MTDLRSVEAKHTAPLVRDLTEAIVPFVHPGWRVPTVERLISEIVSQHLARPPDGERVTVPREPTEEMIEAAALMPDSNPATRERR